MNNTKKFFLSFANENYYDSLNRLKLEAEQMAVFDTILTYTDKDLKKDEKFWKNHHNFIENNARGYGYWIWKPYLILKTLQSMNENDILLYLDAGCKLRPQGIERLNQYFSMVQENKNDIGNLSFELVDCDEKTWTKMDVFNFLDMNKESYLNTKQTVATILFLKKCNHTMELIYKWYNIISNNYNLIDDSYSNSKNDDSFIEHRHDQSIISLLRKKYGTISILDESQKITWSDEEFKNFPILRKGQF